MTMFKRIFVYIPIFLAALIAFGIGPFAAETGTAAGGHGLSPYKVGQPVRIAAYCEMSEVNKNWPVLMKALRGNDIDTYRDLMLKKGVDCIDFRYYGRNHIVAKFIRNLRAYRRTGITKTCFRMIQLKIMLPREFAGKKILSWINVKCAKGQDA
jgi:hypothetical protein